jgi:hypothetical protein
MRAVLALPHGADAMRLLRPAANSHTLVEIMILLGRGRVRPMRASFQIAWCLLGLAIFLALPAFGTHHFGRFYLPVQVRQSASRHSFLVAASCDAEQQAARVEREPLGREPARFAISPSVAPEFVATPRPVARPLLLKRLKLGASGSDAPDPLA